jgi:hypothetical protein
MYKMLVSTAADCIVYLCSKCRNSEKIIPELIAVSTQTDNSKKASEGEIEGTHLKRDGKNPDLIKSLDLIKSPSVKSKPVRQNILKEKILSAEVESPQVTDTFLKLDNVVKKNGGKLKKTKQVNEPIQLNVPIATSKFGKLRNDEVEYKALVTRIERLEKYTEIALGRNRNILLLGIPEPFVKETKARDEYLYQRVRTLLRVVNIPEHVGLKRVHRVGRWQSPTSASLKRPRPVVVEFANPRHRDHFLAGAVCITQFTRGEVLVMPDDSKMGTGLNFQDVLPTQGSCDPLGPRTPCFQSPAPGRISYANVLASGGGGRFPHMQPFVQLIPKNGCSPRSPVPRA